MTYRQQVALIIPCYNEALRLQPQKIVEYVKQQTNTIVYMVNDGSTDNTLVLLNDLAALHERILVYDLNQNSGKAEAIRQTIMYINNTNDNFDVVGFIDADFAAPLSEVPVLVNEMEVKKALIASGARVKILGRNIHRSGMRHYLGRIFATYSVTLLELPNYDTQCGLKLFTKSIAQDIFAEPFISSWFFDIEIFVRTQKKIGKIDYLKSVIEVPLNEWKEIKGSKLKSIDFIKAPFEVLKIYRKYK
jgi:dolichyl-phosphate beta-glucosyltransferase